MPNGNTGRSFPWPPTCPSDARVRPASFLHFLPLPKRRDVRLSCVHGRRQWPQTFAIAITVVLVRSSHVTPVSPWASQPQVHNARVHVHQRHVSTHHHQDDGRRSEGDKRTKQGGENGGGADGETSRGVVSDVEGNLPTGLCKRRWIEDRRKRKRGRIFEEMQRR